MCGIVGYLGKRNATRIIVEGLKKLEYRGYDSAGISTINAGEVEIRRSQGKLANLELLLELEPLSGFVGIGHTRWATHGKPSVENAHPHKAGGVAVVHNGIVENHAALREQLRQRGHTFKSETDSEVISHLVEEHRKTTRSLEEAVRLALRQLKGSYALCIICEQEPGTLIAARHGSPLVVGMKKEEYFIASDVPAILPNTRKLVFLEDGEMAVLCGSEARFLTLDGTPVAKELQTVDWSSQSAEKEGFPHFMLKEIFEQPKAVRDTMAGTLRHGEGDVCLELLGMSDAQLAAVEKIFIVACGSSWHAALVGKYLLEEQCRLPVEVDIASEFRYREPLVSQKHLLLAISQSGETADTLAALRQGKGAGATVVAVTNVVGSSVAREAHGVVYTHAGLEIGVASTKAFVTQLVALYLLAIRLGRSRKVIGPARGKEMIAALLELPRAISLAMLLQQQIIEIACRYLDARDFLFLGRGSHFPIALEGALKLKEISYLHAEGYPAGEMKHGPIALIDGAVPVVVLAPRNRHYDKVVSNLEEVSARGGQVIVVCSEGDRELAAKGAYALELPLLDDALSPIVYAVPLQLLAYHIAVLKGKDVDQPRNLAKCVTVE
jgi:glucosamine--fructose-6-phosphate aminotransferase (isomerizing)